MLDWLLLSLITWAYSEDQGINYKNAKLLRQREMKVASKEQIYTLQKYSISLQNLIDSSSWNNFHAHVTSVFIITSIIKLNKLFISDLRFPSNYLTLLSYLVNKCYFRNLLQCNIFCYRFLYFVSFSLEIFIWLVEADCNSTWYLFNINKTKMTIDLRFQRF